MTNIIAKKMEEKHILIIKGHAGYGVSGTDIICAAVSILGYSLINELKVLEERGEAENVSFGEGEGSLIITFVGDNEKLLTAYETILGGFMALEQDYPDYVNVSRGEKIF